MLDIVGKRIKTVMQSQGLTIQSLAKKLGISRNRLSDMLNGKNEPDYLDMKALRKVFDLSPVEAMWVFFPEDTCGAPPSYLTEADA